MNDETEHKCFNCDMATDGSITIEVKTTGERAFITVCGQCALRWDGSAFRYHDDPENAQKPRYGAGNFL